MDESQIDHVKGIIESLLFVSDKPVTIDQVKTVAKGVNAGDITKIIKGLREEYKNRDGGMIIIEIAGGWQMLSNSLYAEYIREFYKTVQKDKLSRPALETLAIIAYKQPVTRADIEDIRGVNSDGVFVHLLNRGLIKIVGRKEVPGRPFLHGTTKKFLEYFGLKALNDLPKLEDFPTLQAQAQEEQEGEEQEAPQEEVVETPGSEVEEPTTEQASDDNEEGQDEQEASTEETEQDLDDEDDGEILQPDEVEVPKLNIIKEIEQTIDEMEAEDEEEAPAEEAPAEEAPAEEETPLPGEPSGQSRLHQAMNEEDRYKDEGITDGSEQTS